MMGIALGNPLPQAWSEKLLPLNITQACQYPILRNSQTPRIPSGSTDSSIIDGWAPDYKPKNSVKDNWQQPMHTAADLLDSWIARSDLKESDPLAKRYTDLIHDYGQPPSSVFEQWDSCYMKDPQISLGSNIW
jgi:hypothetical protein